MTPYERLMAEEIPVRPPPAPEPVTPKPATEPWTPEEQARHWAELGEAIRDWHWQDDTSLSKTRRHLRLIRQQAA